MVQVAQAHRSAVLHLAASWALPAQCPVVVDSELTFGHTADAATSLWEEVTAQLR